MSHEAVTWAMDDAPMLLTDKGKPDTTARHVLQALAEHANKTGGNAHPSVLRLQYRTGYDRRTVQRALRRLKDGDLIKPTGETDGRTCWQLALTRKRPATDWADLERAEEDERQAAAERQRRSRAKRVTHSASVTVTHSDSVTQPDVTHSNDVSHALEIRDVTHSASARHALNAALTVNQPSPQPPNNQGGGAKGRERDTRSNARARQRPLSLIPADWQPTDADRAAAAADLTRLGPQAAATATAKFVRHHQSRGTTAADFGPAWVTWLTRERPETQGAFLVGLPGGATPTPPTFAERMAELDALAARDNGAGEAK